MLIREDGAKLAGSLADGEVNVPLSEMKLDAVRFTFRFYVNEKPHAFEGKVDRTRLEGKYSGEEASGKLRCERPDQGSGRGRGRPPRGWRADYSEL